MKYIIVGDSESYYGSTDDLEEAENVAREYTSDEASVYIYEVKLKGEVYIPKPEPKTHFFY